MQDWLWATAADLGRGIAAGEIDPEALCEVYLEAIDAHPLRDRIYARITADRARAEAKAAAERARLGLRLSPLDGVPISWKDLFDTAGVATEAGTAMLAGRVPERDAEVLRVATGMGLVCLGKTHLSEIAFSGLGWNPITATPPCVNDDEAVPGGSSSGAAASVAFGLAAAAIGSDTGGSVRVPAAWNDLVGLKTTHGRLPLEGSVALAREFDTVGPLCRSVEDAGLLLAAMEGRRPDDLAGATLEGARFLIVEEVVMHDLAPEVAGAFDGAVARLRAAGAVVETGTHPALEQAYALTAPLYTGDAWAVWKERVEARGDLMFDKIRERVSAGAKVSAADYLDAWDRLRGLRAEWNARVAGYDAVLCPTVAGLPPKLARLAADSGYYVTENLRALRNTRMGNLLGLCGLTLPTGVPSCGVLLNGAPGDEARLLRLGIAAKAALAGG